ncbi:MAG TPA: dUTP diphosphatase [Candidatus Adamsella sp.]|nr:dUTP diphosphatase [Candidatus Adamsella sp.]
MVLKIKKLDNNKSLPEYATAGAAGMDLTAGIDEPMTFKPFERKLVPTGIIIELPHGYEAQVRPRSGMSIKHGITLVNCVGTIDEDYRGELKVPVINLSQEEYTINPGDRIAQMIVAPVVKAQIEVVETVGATNRASGGFGSTGY